MNRLPSVHGLLVGFVVGLVNCGESNGWLGLWLAEILSWMAYGLTRIG